MTDLKVYIELLEKFVGRLEKTWREKSLLESDLKGIEGDFQNLEIVKFKK